MMLKDLTEKPNIIFKILNHYGFNISNEKDKILCPFHNEKTPSFGIYENGTKFKCFGCGAQGDSIDFIEKYENLDKQNAINKFKSIIGEPQTNGFSHHDTKPEPKSKKLQIRFINKNANPRYLFIPIEKLNLSEPTEQDIQNIKKELNKSYSLQTLLKANIKIHKNNYEYGMVFPDTQENKSLIYNPNNIKTYLHLEGRTDWLTAIEMKLYRNFALISDFNKESIDVSNGLRHYFILDRDDSPEKKIKQIKNKNNKKFKFIKLPDDVKDLSDYYNIKNPNIADVLSLITEAKTISFDAPIIKSIVEKDNCYYLSYDGEISEENKIISNFTLEPIYETKQQDNNSKRKEYVFLARNRYGYEEEIKLSSSEWHDLTRFKIAMGNYDGRYLFFGKQSDFNILQQYIYEKSEQKLIDCPSHFGKIENNVWLFKNGILSDGTFIPFDKNKIAYIDKEKTIGYTINTKNEKEIKCSYSEETNKSLENILSQFINIYGNLSYKLFGFAIATIFNDHIYKKYNESPVMFFSGRTQTGKTTGALLTSSLLGADVKLNLTSTTKGISRTLANYKNLPVILDESMNNEDRIKQNEQDNIIIAAYDKTGYQRALKSNDNSTETSEVNASVIYISEFFPTREAVINRSVLCDFNSIQKNNDFFNYMLENKNENSIFLSEILKRININQIFHNIELLKKHFYKYNYDKRVIDNHCIIYGSFLALLRKTDILVGDTTKYKDEHFIELVENLILNDMNKITNLALNTNIYKQYFERIQSLIEKKELTNYIFIKNNNLCFNPKHTYEKIKELDNKTTRDLKANKNDIQIFIEQSLKINKKTIRNTIHSEQDDIVFLGYEIPLNKLIEHNLWEQA